jgi:hypothetical protein
MILSALDPDYNELSMVPGFELPQLREYMDAVDSAIGPEVEEHDLAPQLGEGEPFPSCVNPVEILGKFGGPHRWRGCELSGHRPVLVSDTCYHIKLAQPCYRLCAEVAIVAKRKTLSRS